MIVDVIVRTCPKCGSENIVKNGHDYKGAQKFHCHDCGAYGTLDKKTHMTQKLSTTPRKPILSA